MIDKNKVLDDLNTVGFSVMEQAADREALDTLKEQFEECMNDSSKLKIDNDRFKFVNNPFINCPATVDLIMKDELLEIIDTYMGTVKFGPANLRLSKVTSLPPGDTNLFHRDRNAGEGVTLLKMFFYLHDVEMEHGPFEYIEGSHINKNSNWKSKYRWSDNEVYALYPDKSRFLTAKYGDIIIANTTGFHRGLKNTKERAMYTPLFVDRNVTNGKKIYGINKKQVLEQYSGATEFLNVL